MNLAVVVTLLVMNVTNTLLHAAGASLLIYTYKHGRPGSDNVYVINLALSEFFLNLLQAVRSSLELSSMDVENEGTSIQVQKYIKIVTFTGISFVYYIDMIYLTLDRLLLIVLNIRYPIYWNETKTIWLLRITWLFGILLAILICLLTRYTHYIWEDTFYTYCYPALEILFLVTATFTYVFIFRAFVRSRFNPTQSQGTNIPRPSMFQIFRKSRFRISLLLMFTFLMFMVLPDLLYLIVLRVNGRVSPVLDTYCHISYALSDMLDAVLYIFMEPRVRTLLNKWKRRWCVVRKRNVVKPLGTLSDGRRLNNMSTVC